MTTLPPKKKLIKYNYYAIIHFDETDKSVDILTASTATDLKKALGLLKEPYKLVSIIRGRSMAVKQKVTFDFAVEDDRPADPTLPWKTQDGRR